MTELQELLGHALLQTTRGYTEVHSLDLAAAVDGTSPIGPPSEHSGGQETTQRFDVQGGARSALGEKAKDDYRDGQSDAHGERVRVNVSRAIRATMKRIASYDEKLGLTLERDVETGTYCVFRPSIKSSPTWLVNR